MLDSVKNDMLRSSEPSLSNQSKKNSISVTKKTEESANSSLVVITPKNVTDEQKEGIFWGHFDLNLSKSIEGENFYKASSISMSLDLFAYNKNGLSDEKKQNLSDIFKGDDFKELKNSFFSLNGTKNSIDEFSNEIDDLFTNISKTLDMGEKLFEGSKKLFKFTAIMFSSGLNNTQKIEAENKENKDDNNNINKNLMTDTLATTAKLYGIIGNVDKMKQKIDDAMFLKPNNTIKEYLNNINEKYSIKNKDHSGDLFSTLNRLSKLANKFNKYLN